MQWRDIVPIAGVGVRSMIKKERCFGGLFGRCLPHVRAAMERRFPIRIDVADCRSVRKKQPDKLRTQSLDRMVQNRRSLFVPKARLCRINCQGFLETLAIAKVNARHNRFCRALFLEENHDIAGFSSRRVSNRRQVGSALVHSTAPLHQ